MFDLLPLAWWEADPDLAVTAHGGGTAPSAIDRHSCPQPEERAHVVERRAGAPAFDADMHARALAGETVRWQASSRGRLLESVVGPRRDASGKVSGVAGVAVDVTVGVHERERHAAFAAYVPAAAFVRDAQGRYVWVNDAYAHLYGNRPAEIIGKTVDEVDPAPDVPRFRSLDRQVLQHGNPTRHALPFIRQDGSPGRALGHRFRLETATGPCVGGIYLDITDHVQALAQRAAAEEDLRALRDRSGVASVTLSLSGRIERASPGAAELVGTTVAALEGGHIRDLLAAQETEGIERVWRDLVAGRVVRRCVRLWCRTRGGARRLVRVDLAVAWADGRPVRLLALVTPLGAEHRMAPDLAPIQEQVLLRLARGEANTTISRALGMSRQALDYHLRRLRSLLDAPSRPAVVARGYALGLLDASAWPPALVGDPEGGGALS
ncbi:PAS domain-containing protein [Streptomyces sp. NPDC005125]